MQDLADGIIGIISCQYRPIESTLELRALLWPRHCYLGVGMRIQKQPREVVRDVGGADVITMETVCLIDWTDLAAPPVYGDAVVVGPQAYSVRSHLLQGDGFARIELDNA